MGTDGGSLFCVDSSPTLSGNLFRTQMLCGIKVDIKIDLTNVKNFDYFQAPISSSTSNKPPQKLIFERIEKIGSPDKAKGTPIGVSTTIDIKEIGGRYKVTAAELNEAYVFLKMWK